MPFSQNGAPNRSQSDNSLQSASGARSPPVSSDDKSNHAARMAQQLASQSSWADTYVPATPTATTATPAESTIDEGESERLMRNEDTMEPPPSYEESRRAHAGPSVPQPRQDNVRQEPSIPITEVHQDPPQDPENGDTIPLLIHNSGKVIQRRKLRQKRFFVCFALLAFLLMAIQAIKGIGVGFWRSDGTPIPPIPNRNYTRHETSQSISGTFTFYDSLDLSTSSGSINVIIDPQASDTTGVIRITSKSGSIKVKFAEDYMKGITSSGQLDRVYDIRIQSASGSQNVDLPQGNGGSTRMISQAGSLTGTFTAVHMGQNDNVSTLLTESEYGSQKIAVKSASSEYIAKLSATHHTKGSASIKVAYPSAWEGMVHASVGGAASVSVLGNNLHYQRNGNKDVYAWRLHGDAGKEPRFEGQVVEVRCDGSGSIKVDCSAS